MATEVIMPALNPGQETGILLEWLKQEGETIEKGEPLMEIETDKANVEVEAEVTGILSNISVQPGSARTLPTAGHSGNSPWASHRGAISCPVSGNSRCTSTGTQTVQPFMSGCERPRAPGSTAPSPLAATSACASPRQLWTRKTACMSCT